VLVVEDLHWADAPMLAVLDDLAQNLGDVPLLLLATGRQEVLEFAGDGAGFVSAAEQVPLGPLSGDETGQLILTRLGAKSLPVSLQAALLERSGGNPLFAEELVRLLEDRDLLENRGGSVALRPGVELPCPTRSARSSPPGSICSRPTARRCSPMPRSSVAASGREQSRP
jgi:predicted ATPase